MCHRLAAATFRGSGGFTLRNLMSRGGQYQAGVLAAVEQVGLRAKALHQTGPWFIVLHYSRAFKSVEKVEVFKKITHRVPALTLSLMK